MHILVTGGTGTVGSQVVNELAARKAKVTVLSRDAADVDPPGERQDRRGQPDQARNRTDGLPQSRRRVPAERHEPDRIERRAHGRSAACDSPA